MTTALIIPVYKRPEYLKRCIDSLKKADLSMIGEILFVNDASPDEKVLDMIIHFTHRHCKSSILTSPMNVGIRSSLLRGIGNVIGLGYDTFINLDSDMIVKTDFARELVRLKVTCPDNIISGINCTMHQKTGEERNPLIEEKEDHYLKKYVAGQCLCFGIEQYEKFIRPALLINGNWDHNASIASDQAGLPIVVCKPSRVQHIGFESSMGHNNYGEAPDQAFDFDDRIELPDVTLFGIDAHNPEGIRRAAHICYQGINFGATKIITERLFPGATREEGRRNYSEFMIRKLTEHFSTSHVLTIHDDGYIQNPKAWDDAWLQYDYIGACFDWYNENCVGNGGFSLRSKKLCDILATDPHITDFHPEDDRIARHYRQYLEDKYDIKFAPMEVAKKFSIEAWGLKHEYQVYNGEFGFHGRVVRNLPIPLI